MNQLDPFWGNYVLGVLAGWLSLGVVWALSTWARRRRETRW